MPAGWLVLAARNEKALVDIAEECTDLGAEVQTAVIDVTDTAAVRDLANTARDWRPGCLDQQCRGAGRRGV